MIPFLVVLLEVLLVSLMSDLRFEYTKQSLLNEGGMHIGKEKPGRRCGCFPVPASGDTRLRDCRQSVTFLFPEGGVDCTRYCEP